ncbi:MAG: hypothetical protein KFF50_12000 [Desulfatitalea sp.]|nr:hypothetical protein [Desulfatitalea sp.]
MPKVAELKTTPVGYPRQHRQPNSGGKIPTYPTEDFLAFTTTDKPKPADKILLTPAGMTLDTVPYFA